MRNSQWLGLAIRVTQGGEAVSGLRLSDHHTSPTPKLAPETQVEVAAEAK